MPAGRVARRPPAENDATRDERARGRGAGDRTPCSNASAPLPQWGHCVTHSSQPPQSDLDKLTGSKRWASTPRPDRTPDRLALATVAMAGLLLAGCGGAAASGRTESAACAGARVTVDREAQELGGCVTIDGDLLIYGPTLSSLAPLDSLSTVRGDLVIGPTASLRTLNGLGNLQSVSGDVRVEETLRLDSVTLAGLVEVGGSLRIENNRDLAVVAVPALQTVGRHLFIDDNPDLLDVNLGPTASVGGERFVQTEDGNGNGDGTDVDVEVDADADADASEVDAEGDGSEVDVEVDADADGDSSE